MELPRIVADVWWCQDEVCDCTQARIYILSKPNLYHYEMLWEGTFVCEEGEISERELKDAIRDLLPGFVEKYRLPCEQLVPAA